MSFAELGYEVLRPDPAMQAWIGHAGGQVDAVLADPANAKWLRYGGTWFAGVNVLPNNATGALPGGPPLSGPVVQRAREHSGLASVLWDQGQLSVCFTGYPQPMAGESEGVFRYRVQRDAAHVDGLRGVGPEKRRFLAEPHAFILGIPLDAVEAGMSPFVVWEGSHEVMRRALAAALAGVAPEQWPNVDITEAYKTARREAFATCRRLELTTQAGETYIAHRLLLHGVAPWGASSSRRRAVVYFRPLLPRLADWLG